MLHRFPPSYIYKNKHWALELDVIIDQHLYILESHISFRPTRHWFVDFLIIMRVKIPIRLNSFCFSDFLLRWIIRMRPVVDVGWLSVGSGLFEKLTLYGRSTESPCGLFIVSSD